jgi:hypothetical protein
MSILCVFLLCLISSPKKLTDFYESWCESYPVIFIYKAGLRTCEARAAVPAFEVSVFWGKDCALVGGPDISRHVVLLTLPLVTPNPVWFGTSSFLW